MSSEHGHLIVVTAPSGAGKSTMVQIALARVPDLAYSISYTTRQPRGAEVNGKEYIFVSLAEFQAMRERGDFLESAEVHGNYYASSRRAINEFLSNGRDVILDIDVQGAAQLREVWPHAVTVFVMPPSFPVLAERLRARNTENRYNVERRLKDARAEVARYREFDYVIVNDNLTAAGDALIAIITAARYQRDCQEKTVHEIMKTFVENVGGEGFHA